MADEAARLNADSLAAATDRVALDAALQAHGADFSRLMHERPHLYAAAACFVSAAHLAQMRAVIAATERVVQLPGWQAAQPGTQECLGVFMGYDFHLNADGAHLIEINTNAGGAFLNALLLHSQRGILMPGQSATPPDPEQAILDMFRQEWLRVRGAVPLGRIAIVDESPEQQYLYPEFLLAQRLFEHAGVSAPILDPAALELRGDGLYHAGSKIDLVYNRLTDFSLESYPALGTAYRNGLVVVTPNPAHHARYADKRKLAHLTDVQALHALGADEETCAILQSGIPQTREVLVDEAERWWEARKQWFFKPVSGYGGKGAYRGDKLTRRVFDEIMRGGYVAQRLAVPGERVVRVGDATQALKYDVRCYVYGGQLQLVVARLYQGQTTNFRTPGGGFAQVRVV